MFIAIVRLFLHCKYKYLNKKIVNYFCINLSLSLQERMADEESASRKKRRFTLDEKVKSKKFNHSFIKELKGTGRCRPEVECTGRIFGKWHSGGTN
jgi:hypothetical protein